MLVIFQLPLHQEPFELRSGPRPEHFEHGEVELGQLHALRIHHCEMSKDLPVRARHRNRQIAFDVNLLQFFPVKRELVGHLFRAVIQFARQNELARGMGDGIFEIRFKAFSCPEGKRPYFGAVGAEFGHEGIADVEHLGQLLDQGRKELLADLRLDAFDNLAERRTRFGQSLASFRHLPFQRSLRIPQPLFGLFEIRHITGHGEQPVRLAVLIEYGTDGDIPPFRGLRLCRREEAGEVADPTLARRLDGGLSIGLVGTSPEVYPG